MDPDDGRGNGDLDDDDGVIRGGWLWCFAFVVA